MRCKVNAVALRYLALWLAILALIWAAYGFARSAIIDNMERYLQHRLETDTLVLEDHASRALDAVVSRLEAVAALSTLEELNHSRVFSRTLKDMLFDDTTVRSLSLVNAQGLIVASSNLSNVGRPVSQAAWASIGRAAPQSGSAVHFGGALAQRDLPELPAHESESQAIWLGQIEAKAADLAGYRWVAAINTRFFQNFWSAALRRQDVQVGLFNYQGMPLVALGQGPANAAYVAHGLAQALQMRESGELRLEPLSDWRIRYRASSRHPTVFVMFVDQRVQVAQQIERTGTLRWAAWGGSLLATAVIGLFYVIARRYRRTVRMSTQLRQDAQTDALTGLANRRAFNEWAPLELSRAAALGAPLSLMLLDLDHFKSINDQFGHAAGDVVLLVMASRWQALLRSRDLIARIGGEEFCLVLPGTGYSQAQAVAQRLIDETRKEPVILPASETALPVTVSIGVVGIDACPADLTLASLMAMADSALYRAKEKGRNQLEAIAWPGP